MNWKLSLIIGVIFVVPSACDGTKVKLPIETSIGNLVRIEKVDSVATDERTTSAEAGKTLYLLSFEGKGEIKFEGSEKDAFKNFVLVDSKGTEFTHVFAGSSTSTGTLSTKDWIYNGELKGQNGKFVFVGVLSVPAAKLSLVYVVPKEASRLSLTDGAKRHLIN